MIRHTSSIRVRYEETDRMGVVYYANHLVWFEVARTELFRKFGLSYRELEEKDHLRLMVIGASCEYKSPATYDDIINVEACISEMRQSSMKFDYTVRRDSTLIATGSTAHVFTDAKGKPVKIPEKIRKALSL